MNLIDYDQEGIMPMYNPPHPGESLRGALDNTGWTVTECAARLGMARNTLSRVLNGSVGISANMALALEGIGWSNAEYWMRRQATYDLAQARVRRKSPPGSSVRTRYETTLD